MKTSKEIIGVNIKFQRKEKKYTQQHLADLLGVDRQYVWRMENGKVNMTLDYLDTIIEKLNCRHSDFIFILPLADGRADGHLDGHMDGRADGHLDGHMDGRADGYVIKKKR